MTTPPTAGPPPEDADAHYVRASIRTMLIDKPRNSPIAGGVRSIEGREFTPEQLECAREFLERGGLENALKAEVRRAARDGEASRARDPALGDAAAERRVALSPMPEAQLNRFMRAFDRSAAREALVAMSEELTRGPSYIETAVLLRILEERLAEAR